MNKLTYDPIEREYDTNKSHWEDVIATIKRLSQPNCDDYSKRIATPETLRFVESRSRKMMNLGIACPVSLMVTYDGSIHMEWHDGDCVILDEVEGVIDSVAFGNTLTSPGKGIPSILQEWKVPIVQEIRFFKVQSSQHGMTGIAQKSVYRAEFKEFALAK